ncbi:MAG: tetratricopeptide repeat protein [Bacteroidota bacterium]|nr:tetratricopeptide repeat protein [Bacteroidota bacterium]
MRTTLIFLATVLLTWPIFSQEEAAYSAFAKANQAYTNENYEIAITGYEQVLSTGLHSADVYFNLANAHYKLNQVGPAIYNYEKALELDPENEDIKSNLAFANRMKIDAIESLPQDNLSGSLQDTIKSLSVDEWAYFSVIAALFTILFIVLYIYAGTTSKKRLFFILFILTGILFLSTAAAAFYSSEYLDKKQFAIVYIEEFTTRNEPKNSAGTSFVIHEGTKVEVLEEFNDWAHIQLANGSKAWMPLEDLKKL